MIALVLQHHPHGAFTDLRGKGWGWLRDGSILARVGASGKSIVVHYRRSGALIYGSINQTNTKPKTLVCTKSLDDILATVKRFSQRTSKLKALDWEYGCIFNDLMVYIIGIRKRRSRPPPLNVEVGVPETYCPGLKLLRWTCRHYACPYVGLVSACLLCGAAWLPQAWKTRPQSCHEVHLRQHSPRSLERWKGSGMCVGSTLVF